MTKRTMMLAAWALALTAALSASPADVDTSDTTPLAELSAVTGSQSTSVPEATVESGDQTGEVALTSEEPPTIDPEGSEVAVSETENAKSDDTDPLAANDSLEDLDDLDDLLEDLDDLLAGLDEGIGELEDSFDDNEGDVGE